jgi:hypothetical protein
MTEFKWTQLADGFELLDGGRAALEQVFADWKRTVGDEAHVAFPEQMTYCPIKWDRPLPMVQDNFFYSWGQECEDESKMYPLLESLSDIPFLEYQLMGCDTHAKTLSFALQGADVTWMPYDRVPQIFVMQFSYYEYICYLVGGVISFDRAANFCTYDGHDPLSLSFALHGEYLLRRRVTP